MRLIRSSSRDATRDAPSFARLLALPLEVSLSPEPPQETMGIAFERCEVAPTPQVLAEKLLKHAPGTGGMGVGARGSGGL